jgi:hypothetical protein
LHYSTARDHEKLGLRDICAGLDFLSQLRRLDDNFDFIFCRSRFAKEQTANCTMVDTEFASIPSRRIFFPVNWLESELLAVRVKVRVYHRSFDLWDDGENALLSVPSELFVAANKNSSE